MHYFLQNYLSSHSLIDSLSSVSIHGRSSLLLSIRWRWPIISPLSVISRATFPFPMFPFHLHIQMSYIVLHTTIVSDHLRLFPHNGRYSRSIFRPFLLFLCVFHGF